MDKNVLDVRSGGAKAFLESWRADAKGAMALMTDCLQRKGLNGPAATIPELSTMTVIFQTDCEIDIVKLREASAIHDGVPGEPSGGRIALLATGSKDSTFSNQVSFRYMPGTSASGRKNCKVFKRGKFHLTGARSAAEALRTLKVVIRVIRALRPDCTDEGRAVKVQSAKVQLLNTDFRLNSPVNLEALRDAILQKYGTYCRYEPDHFAGCNVKLRTATVLVFKSGCVIITGAKRMVDIAHAFAFIIGAVLECPAVLDSNGKTEAWEADIAKKEQRRLNRRSFVDLLDERVDDKNASELPSFEVVSC